MKNKTFLAIVCAIVLIGAGLAIYQLSASPVSANLSKEEAQTKAQIQFPGEVTEIELNDDGNKPTYEIEIEGSDRSYEIQLDANTGEILHLDEKERTIVKNDQGDDAKTDDQQDDVTPDDSSDDLKDNADDSANDKEEVETKSTTDKNTPIKADKAKEIALAEIDGKIIEFELDEDDGYLYYEIEMITDKNEVDIEIDAYTGEIMTISLDDLDD
ncbi:PepSY domain-containing protein [Aquibacillus rhizosphaerae]|uniref:PepSY domain-containing protein n=1 Tax=Aquibacillus rhizosphaerae TaxID=3051431 RepID=A0ABT7L5U7_9BACI|nr:PepSY domain-containing protein [Aquibacillus sp. LR5S19]MDL4840575.1 PepSY domain-containing protein [Aquibacillus sp. LR5S19]